MKTKRTKKVLTAIYLTEEERNWLRELSEKNYRSISSTLRYMIADKMNREKRLK